MNEVIEMQAQNQPAPTQTHHVPVQTTPADLLRIAVEQGADLDKLERLMDLQDRYNATQAKKAYDQAFAAFKSEAVRVIRNKDVTDGPLRGKSYAELHDWVNAVTPALSKHGLSSSWKLTKDEKDWIEVTCYVRHVGGHEESVSMGGPPDTGGAKNAIQARASAKSYLERYTLKAITGLSEQNDDTDGNKPADTALGDSWVSQMAQADTVEAMEAAWSAGCKDIDGKNDLNAFKVFRQAYADKKKILKEEK